MEVAYSIQDTAPEVMDTFITSTILCARPAIIRLGSPRVGRIPHHGVQVVQYVRFMLQLDTTSAGTAKIGGSIAINSSKKTGVIHRFFKINYFKFGGLFPGRRWPRAFADNKFCRQHAFALAQWLTFDYF